LESHIVPADACVGCATADATNTKRLTGQAAFAQAQFLMQRLGLVPDGVDFFARRGFFKACVIAIPNLSDGCHNVNHFSPPPAVSESSSASCQRRD